MEAVKFFYKNNLGKKYIDREAGGVYYSAVGLGGQAHATLNSQAAGKQIFLFPSTMGALLYPLYLQMPTYDSLKQFCQYPLMEFPL